MITLKRIILIMMLLLSFTTFADDSLVTQFVTKADLISQIDSYTSIVDNATNTVDNISDYCSIDYLTAVVELDKALWLYLTKQQKVSALLALEIVMYDKTKMTDITVMVDYTTVLMVLMDKVFIERVY